MDDRLRHVRPSDRFGWSVAAVVVAGIILRVGFWIVHVPSPKVYFIFNPDVVDQLDYLLSFESSHPIRMPYYDVLAYWTYHATAWLFGVRSVSLFNLLASIVALPLFYLGVRSLFDRTVAFFALLLIALYPKLLVMTAGAIPEVAAVSFAAMSLYPLSITIERGGTLNGLAAGILATLSFLMYDPAVAFLGLTVLFLYAERSNELLDRAALDHVFVAYAAPGAIFSFLYAILGPIASALSVGTGGGAGFGTGSRELFLHPERLSMLEKGVRFVLYSYFDFWWHIRGYDTEGMILTLLDGLVPFMGPIFPVYFGGWVVVTLLLTAGIASGIVTVSRRRDVRSAFVLVWIGGYVTLFLLTNLGWKGAFQTRHVLPVLPAIAIAFGIGVEQMSGPIALWFEGVGLPSVPGSWGWISTKTVFGLLLAILVINAGGQLVLQSGDNYQKDRQPVERLDEYVGEDEQVAVIVHDMRNFGIGGTHFREVVLYSGGRIRPIVLAANGTQATRIRKQTIGTDVRAGSPDELIRSFDSTTYLYLKSTCESFGGSRQAFLRNATNDGGEVVYENHQVTGSAVPCELNMYVVRLNTG